MTGYASVVKTFLQREPKEDGEDSAGEAVLIFKIVRAQLGGLMAQRRASKVCTLIRGWQRSRGGFLLRMS
jgi:hypothetical protein